MEGRRFNTIFALLAASFLGLVAHQASASPITIEFDEDDIGSTEDLALEDGYAGFQWGERWVLGSTDMSTAYKDAAGASGGQFLYNKGQVTEGLTVKRDTPFDFLGVTLGASTITSGPSSRAYWVTVTASYADGGEDSIDKRLFTEDSFTGNSFRVDTSFKNITELRFTPNGGVFTLDDFSYQDIEAKVNEAGGLILLGIGLFGLWAARRRIRA